MKSMNALEKSPNGPDLPEEIALNIEKILNSVREMEFTKSKSTNYKIPKVVDRLLQDCPVSYHHSKPGKRKVIYRKAPEIREVKKQVSIRDGGPSSTHYDPNYNAILKSAPKFKFSSSFPEKKEKIQNLNVSTISEMINSWTTEIRETNFSSQEPTTIDNCEIFSSFTPSSSLSDAPGIISNSGHNLKWVGGEKTPGVGSYDLSQSDMKGKMIVSFDKQSSRPPQKTNSACLHDTRSGLDAIKPRAPRAPSFEKQSSRFPLTKNNDSLWDEIEAEQKEILSKLDIPQRDKTRVKKKVQPFSLQTTNFDKSPFHHIMRKETEPSQSYDTERAYRRPKTAFNISQPAFQNDRAIYCRSEAPDVIYDNVQQQYNNTIKKTISNIAFCSQRISPYPYKFNQKKFKKLK